jgi:formylglycine-generating enzyme required for sulfatase activity
LKAFEIHRTEVSVAQYKACVDAGGCTPPSTRPEWPGASAAEKRQWSAFCNWGKPDKANHPVNCVDWKQARAYCQWQGGRLPTEAEWELAARGTDGRTYPWGNSDPDDAKARFGHLTGGTVPVETGSAGASAFGLLQMAGNVWEWVADAYGPYPGGSATDPFRDDGSQRVVRGGGWASDKPVKLRATIRDSNDPSSRLSDVGFRCARTPSHL